MAEEKQRLKGKLFRVRTVHQQAQPRHLRNPALELKPKRNLERGSVGGYDISDGIGFDLRQIVKTHK
jgi:thiamine monophosphate kinase